jgi:hypothetical protein
VALAFVGVLHVSLPYIFIFSLRGAYVHPTQIGVQLSLHAGGARALPETKPRADAIADDEALGPGAYHDAIAGFRAAFENCSFPGL